MRRCLAGVVFPASAPVLSSSQPKKQTNSLQRVLLGEDLMISPTCEVGGHQFDSRKGPIVKGSGMLLGENKTPIKDLSPWPNRYCPFPWTKSCDCVQPLNIHTHTYMRTNLTTYEKKYIFRTVTNCSGCFKQEWEYFCRYVRSEL